MATIRGNDFMFGVLLNGNREVLCHATDFTLNTVAESIETTGPNNGAWRSYIPGLLSYSLSVPALVSYTDPLNIVQLQELQYSRQTVEWFAGLDLNGGLLYHGFMFITSINMTSQMRDAVKFDMSAQGTGQQDILKLPTTKVVPLTNTQGIILPGCPSPYPVGLLWYDGTPIGVAGDEDDVIALYNTYSDTQGGFVHILGSNDNCMFTIQIEWNSPISPDFIPATTAPGFALRGTNAAEAIGGAFNTNEVISA